MEIKILTSKQFLDNQKFFHMFIEQTYDESDAFDKQKNLAEYALREVFWVIACDGKKIYSMATFENLGPAYGIDNVATHPLYRRKGFAEKVLRAGVEFVRFNCVLEVKKTNQSAINLYTKLGFVPSNQNRPFKKETMCMIRRENNK